MVGELGPGGTMAQGGQIQTGGGSTASLEDFEGMADDRAALAAYTMHFAYDSAADQKERDGRTSKPWPTR